MSTLSELSETLRFISSHPLSSRNRRSALARWLRWQIGSRILPGAVAVPFVGDTRLLVRPGMTGATGNIYTGLHEFEDMGFLLHLLRPGDLFVDTGANVGTYTVLAAGVCGANVDAIEPIRKTFNDLVDNVRLNGIAHLVKLHQLGIGAEPSVLRFSADRGPMNAAIPNGEKYEGDSVEVHVVTLDDLLEHLAPRLIKIDVEGYEAEVLSGASRTLSDMTLAAVIMEQLSEEEGEAHKAIKSYGFCPYRYDPLSRTLLPLRGKNPKPGNTIYIQDLVLVRERIASAPRRSVLGQSV